MATPAQEWRQEGLEEGRLTERVVIARKLLALHDVVTVSELTGLSIEEVQALRDTEQTADPDTDTPTTQE